MCRLLYWAVGSALPATAGAMLLVLEERSEASGQQPGVSCLPEDGLALLHSAAQSSRAAALARAEELAGRRDGLSLLHRAVQSQSAAMLAEVARWGEEASQPLRCDMAGPMGLTPLHLAALVPDAACARQMVALLLRGSAGGPAAWEALLTADGLSPADFSRRAGHRGLAPPAAAAAAAAAAASPAQGAGPSGLEGWAPTQLRVLKRAKTKGSPWEEGMQPSTPRRCLCVGDCPCASAAEPCACCASDDDPLKRGCGSQDGKCACCRTAGAADEAGGGCCGLAAH